MDGLGGAFGFGDHALEVVGESPLGCDETRFGRGQVEVRDEAGGFRFRQFGQLSPYRLDPRLRKLQWRQVGFGEVAVVVRLFLAALGLGHFAHIVPAERFLHHRPARLV